MRAVESSSAERDAVARAYEKAAALEQTLLAYEDWITARTLGFKTWFGDWEAARTRRQLFAMIPVPVPQTAPDTKPLSAGKSEIEAVRVTAWENYKKARSKGRITMHDGREVELTRVGFTKTRFHTADRQILDLLSKMRALLENAAPITSLPHEDETNTNRAATRAWHYYAVKVSLNGQKAYTKLVVREDVNKTIYYDANLSSPREIEGLDGRERSAIPEDKPEAGLPSVEGRRLFHLLAGVNSKPVSNTIHPKTGEPTAEAILDYERQLATQPRLFP